MLRTFDADDEQRLFFISANFPEHCAGSGSPMQVTLVTVGAPSPFIGGDSRSARCSLGLACTFRDGQGTFAGLWGLVSLRKLDHLLPQAVWPGPAEVVQPTPWWPQTRSPTCWTCTCSWAVPSPLPAPTRSPQVSGGWGGAGVPRGVHGSVGGQSCHRFGRGWGWI